MENAQAISTTDAFKMIGPYSQGITAGQFLFISGPFPVRSAIQVSGLQLGSNIEAEGIVYIP